MARRIGAFVATLILFTLVGCSRDYIQAENFKRELTNSAGMVLGVLDGVRSFSQGQDIVSEFTVTVKRSNRKEFPSGTVLKVFRSGGSVQEGADAAGQPIVRQMIVDDGVILPAVGSEVFLVLRADGNRLWIFDGVPVKNGQFTIDRWRNQFYEEIMREWNR